MQAIPSTRKLEGRIKIGGRIRGPSPVIHQWIEFCLQTARAFPFREEIIPGASPSAIGGVLCSVEAPEEQTKGKGKGKGKGKPKLETNLIAGIPPPDILDRCEFLEPLSDATLSDYERLIASLERPNQALRRCILSMKQHFLQR